MEEGLNVGGGGLEILSEKRFLNAVKAVGAIDDGVDAEEGVLDARLGEIEVADLGGDLIGEVGGGGDVGKHVGGVALDDLQNVGGFVEVGELAI